MKERKRNSEQSTISFSFIHLAAQRCIAPICHAQELRLDRSAEFGSGAERDLVSHAVLCPAWTLSHANNVFPLGLVTCQPIVPGVF